MPRTAINDCLILPILSIKNGRITEPCPKFKDFLRRKWEHISKVTGQPIGFHLLDLEQFNYDTEPAYRTVVSAQHLQAKNQLPKTIILDFYTAVQYKFYVRGINPTKVDFYASICKKIGLNFVEFKTIFENCESKFLISSAFKRSREWDVKSFSILLMNMMEKSKHCLLGSSMFLIWLKNFKT